MKLSPILEEPLRRTADLEGRLERSENIQADSVQKASVPVQEYGMPNERRYLIVLDLKIPNSSKIDTRQERPQESPIGYELM